MEDEKKAPGPVGPPIAVCYLARLADGTDQVRRFVESYRTHPAGVDHELVVLFKGFPDPSSKQPWRDIFAGVAYRELDFKDVGLSLVPFVTAAKVLEHDFFLFLNTSSAFNAPNWLAMMHGHVTRPGVGVVGATASCGSHYTILRDKLFRVAPVGHRETFIRWLKIYCRRREKSLRWLKAHFDPFPNFHIRTTGFLVSREVMRRIELPPIRVKYDGYRFESGKGGFTAQVRGMGLQALVVGRDGVAYGPHDVKGSNTYFQNSQENLLISDRLTDVYKNSDPEQRRWLIPLAWGAYNDENII